MKKWMIGAALLVFTSLSVAAQQERKELPNPEERAKKMTERMASDLQLSEDQKEQVLAINLENAKKRQAEIEKEMAERKARMEEMKAQNEKIKSVLTEEQRQKWEEIKLDRRDQRRPGGEIHDRRSLHHQGRKGY
jgi:Spy/CpxP family protein refolding chaperone